MKQTVPIYGEGFLIKRMWKEKEKKKLKDFLDLNTLRYFIYEKNFLYLFY